MRLPGVVLPVNPSTLRDSKHLQKSDPSGYPSEGVNEPSIFAVLALLAAPCL
jgi:hypothetical protein